MKKDGNLFSNNYCPGTDNKSFLTILFFSLGVTLGSEKDLIGRLSMRPIKIVVIGFIKNDAFAQTEKAKFKRNYIGSI